MKTSQRRSRLQRGVHGFSLVELLIAMVLGLLVVGSALAIFMSNRQTYSATESLGRNQENRRLAFDPMARDLREAGSTPCGNSRRTVSSVLNGTGWYDWGDAITGYDGGVAIPGVPFGTANGNRIAGTDAIEVHSGNAGGVKAVTHNDAGGVFEMVDANHGYTAGEVVVACDYMRGAIFQITSVAAEDITYSAGAGSPGNSTINLGGCLEAECTPGLYQFQDNSLVTRLGASRWYIGANDDPSGTGRSLYLQTLLSGFGTAPEEIARGVQDLRITYLLNTNPNYYVDRIVTPGASYANSVAANEWNRVLAVRLVMTWSARTR